MAVTISLKEIQQALPDLGISGHIKRGGQGAVYLGEVAGEPVAVKVVDPTGNDKRIDREINALQKIHCPNLVRVISSREANVGGRKARIVIYEYHSGGDLNVSSPWTTAEILRLALEASRGIESLWSQRIVHRDVKPANIVKAADGRFVLVDLGWARHLDLSPITPQGYWCGTPGYMSPEQAMGRQGLTIRSDIFALGITLFLTATGIHPFCSSQPSFSSPSAPKLTSFRPDLAPVFCAIVDSMLAIDFRVRPLNVVQLFEQFTGAKDVST